MLHLLVRWTSNDNFSITDVIGMYRSQDGAVLQGWVFGGTAPTAVKEVKWNFGSLGVYLAEISHNTD